MLDGVLAAVTGGGFPWRDIFSVVALIFGTGGALQAFLTNRKTVRLRQLDVQAEALRLHEADKAHAAELASAELTRIWDAYKAQEQEIGALRQEMVDLRKHRHDLANDANRLSLENAVLKKEIEILEGKVNNLQERLDQALIELAAEKARRSTQ